eukprot:5802972-Amphidinium_carterae.1
MTGTINSRGWVTLTACVLPPPSPPWRWGAVEATTWDAPMCIPHTQSFVFSMTMRTSPLFGYANIVASTASVAGVGLHTIALCLRPLLEGRH